MIQDQYAPVVIFRLKIQDPQDSAAILPEQDLKSEISTQNENIDSKIL